jgi:hypothetical protein
VDGRELVEDSEGRFSYRIFRYAYAGGHLSALSKPLLSGLHADAAGNRE